MHANEQLVNDSKVLTDYLHKFLVQINSFVKKRSDYRKKWWRLFWSLMRSIIEWSLKKIGLKKKKKSAFHHFGTNDKIKNNVERNTIYVYKRWSVNEAEIKYIFYVFST